MFHLCAEIHVPQRINPTDLSLTSSRTLMRLAFFCSSSKYLDRYWLDCIKVDWWRHSPWCFTLCQDQVTSIKWQTWSVRPSLIQVTIPHGHAVGALCPILTWKTLQRIWADVPQKWFVTAPCWAEAHKCLMHLQCEASVFEQAEQMTCSAV